MKWVEALALLFLAGQLLLSRLAGRSPPLEWVTPGFRASSIALSAGLVAVWSEATVGSGGHSVAGYLAFFNGLSGAALIARLVLRGADARRGGTGWRTLPVWIAGALVMLARLGHAAGVDPAWYGIGLDAMHLLAAGLWAGGIAALALLRPPGGWRSGEARVLLARFTPVALAAFAATRGRRRARGDHPARVDPGPVRHGLRTRPPGQDGPGRPDAAALGDGVAAQAAARPRRGRAGRRRGRGGGSALVLPDATHGGRPSGGRGRGGDPDGAGFPPAGELTMAGAAGSDLVGLSLSPGRPGRIAPPSICSLSTEAAAARGVAANIAVNGVYKALLPCGDTCRERDHRHQTGRPVSVDVLNRGGGEAAFTIPALPAPSGDDLVTQLEAAMHGLHRVSVRVRSSARAPRTVTARYSVGRARPHDVDDQQHGHDHLDRHDTCYTQEAPGQPWQPGSRR